jgi:hypothetical protein
MRIVLHAIFGETALRFGGMFGVFVRPTHDIVVIK